MTKARSAYDLWLTENIKHADMVRFKTIDESFSQFREQGYEVLAGLRPKLLEERDNMPGSRILDGSFTVIGQSAGCNKNLPEAAAFIEQCVQQAIKTGLIEKWIQEFNVVGKLSVPE